MLQLLKASMSEIGTFTTCIAILCLLLPVHGEIELTVNSSPINTYNVTIVRNVVNNIACVETNQTVSWSYDGEDISSDPIQDIHQKDGTLFFSVSNSFDNEGDYICKSSSSTKTITLTIHVPVHSIRIETSDGNESNGDYFVFPMNSNLLCLASGNPSPQIQWQTPTDIISGASLTLSSLQTNQSYSCNAVNTVHDDRTYKINKTIMVTIQEETRLINASNTPASREDITLQCQFKGNPTPSVSWTTNGNVPSTFYNVTNKNENYKTNSTLSMSTALCLGNIKVHCNSNAIAQHQFEINKEPYSVFQKNYYFYKFQKTNFSDTHDICLVEHGAELLCGDTLTFYQNQHLKQQLREWNNTKEGFFARNCSNGNSCLFISNDLKEISMSNCDKEMEFICQTTAAFYPTNLNSTFGGCSKHINVTWTNAGGVLSNIDHRVVVKDPTTIVVSNMTKEGFWSFPVVPRTFYQIAVYAGGSICQKPPFAEFGTVSGYGTPEKLQATRSISGYKCNITWKKPNYHNEITHFDITVKNIVTNSSTNLQQTNEQFFYQLAMEAMASYSIFIKSVSHCGESGPETELTCTRSPEAPTVLSPISEDSNLPKDSSGRITIPAENGIKVNYNRPDEINGTISCISVVVTMNTKDANPRTSTSDTMNQISNILSADEISLLKDGDSYLAYTSRNQALDLVIGGNRQNTSCNPSSYDRKKRELNSTSYRGTNIALNPDKTYQFYIFTTTPDGSTILYATTAWSSMYLTNSGSVNNPTTIIVVVIVLLLLIIIILIIIFVVWKKRHHKKSESNFDSYNNRNNGSNGMHINAAFTPGDDQSSLPVAPPPIPLNKMKEVYLQKHADEDLLFRAEYANLATQVKDLEINYDYSERMEVRAKNRFSNIHSANDSRVVLRRNASDEYSDYINASYIHGYRHPNRYIATQGPIPNTISDFWFMVYDQESKVIVMLTRLMEFGRKKCEQYWPDNNETKTYGNIIVTHLSTVVMGDIVKRTFECSDPNHSSKKHQVEQFHFIAWPDHGIPNTTSSLFNLRRMVQESQGQWGSPLIIHCSAGVGRSGAFIVLDIMLSQIRHESRIDIFSIVMNMRRRRKEMVQTVEQYSLIHKLAWEAFIFRELKDRSVEEFNTFFGSQEKKIYEDDREFYEKEFSNLKTVPPIKTSSVEVDSSLLRNPQVFPYHHSKVVVRMRPNESTPPFYNASNIKSYDPSNEFIVCQAPFVNQIEEFWRVVIDNDVKCIAMFTELQEDDMEKCAKYWPDKPNKTTSFGNIEVFMLEENRVGNITERTLKLNEKVSYMERETTVKQFHFHGWFENAVPKATDEILQLVDSIQKERQKNNLVSPVLVHCSDGAGRSGTFCAITTLIERIKNENRIDVFRTVKDLRDLRPLMVQTVEQYEFCYKVVRSYLGSFELYSNFQ